MFRLSLTLLLSLAMLLLASCSSQPASYSYNFIYGKSLMMRGRYAVAPKDAPEAVKRAVAAGNRLQGKPYIYGGGHRRVEDKGYDCSGTASYMLYYAGLLSAPTHSDAFRSWGKPGPGKWITIYAKRGHVFSVIGGLRLDTGYNGQNEGPKWSTKPRPTKGFVARHPPGL